MKTKKKYYYYSLRGFANEYQIIGSDKPIAVVREEIGFRDDSNKIFKRIPYRDAISLTAHNRKMYKTGQATFQNPAGATMIDVV